MLKWKSIRTVFIGLCIALCCFSCERAHAQTYVYLEEPFFYHQMELNLENGILCEGFRSSWAEAIFTIEDDHIYQGFSSSVFDLLYTFRNNQLFLQDSNFASDVQYTFEQGKIYRGDSTFPLDLIYTIRNGKVYTGDSISIFDRVLVMDGRPKPAEVFAILFAMGLL